MISRATFSYILDGMKEYYDARTDIYDLEQTGSFGYGNLVDAEDVILTLLVESVDDRDGLIYDWLHGTIQTQEDGVVRLELSLGNGYSHQFTIDDAGDLYDYLILLNDPEMQEVSTVRQRRGFLLGRYVRRDLNGGNENEKSCKCYGFKQRSGAV